MMAAGADGRFDAIVVANLLGRIDDPRGVLHGLKEQIRPGGALIVALDGIAPIDGGRLAIVDVEPLGAGERCALFRGGPPRPPRSRRLRDRACRAGSNGGRDGSTIRLRPSWIA